MNNEQTFSFKKNLFKINKKKTFLTKIYKQNFPFTILLVRKVLKQYDKQSKIQEKDRETRHTHTHTSSVNNQFFFAVVLF